MKKREWWVTIDPVLDECGNLAKYEVKLWCRCHIRHGEYFTPGVFDFGYAPNDSWARALGEAMLKGARA